MLTRLLRPALFVIACSAAIACAAPPIASGSGAGATVPLHSAPQPLTTSSPTVVVSDASLNGIVFCGPGSPCNDCKTIGSGLNLPMGVTSNTGGGFPASTLEYVADSGNQRVVVFTAKCKTVRILDDSGYLPSDVAVAHDGTVAVTNLCAAPSCTGSGNISFYAPGSTKATSVATGLISQYYYGDFDKHGNFYNDGFSGSTVEVGVVPHGATTDKATGISGIKYPGGIQIARNGTINIDDQSCACIQIYKGNHKAGTVSLTGVTKPVTFALDKSNKYLWVTDVSSKTVDQFAYPGGGAILFQFTGFYEPIGVAVVPPDKP